jgi:hypothetical protein
MTANDQTPVIAPLDPSVDHVRGPAGSPLILEYGDYECPYSRQAFREIERIEKRLNARTRARRFVRSSMSNGEFRAACVSLSAIFR